METSYDAREVELDVHALRWGFSRIHSKTLRLN